MAAADIKAFFTLRKDYEQLALRLYRERYNVGEPKRTSSGGKLYWRGLDGKVLAETDSSGNPDKEYIYVQGMLIGYVTGSNVRYYYFGDHLGTAKLLM